ncbi:MAG: hypothetical protein WCO25_02670 [Candidatus Uhrbacteria bacterium]
MDERIQRIEERLTEIERRNGRVEVDKSWETSSFRIVSICAITYVVAATALFLIGVRNPVFNALIPTVGFLLSTQTLPVLKDRWIKNHLHRK